MQLAQTEQRFQDQINAIAGVANMPSDQVYELWCRYARQCTLYDQSPVIFEFINSWGADLGGDRCALSNAVNAVNPALAL